MTDPDRRRVLKIAGAALAAPPAMLATHGARAADAGTGRPPAGWKGFSPQRMADLPRAQGPRLVIIGAGTSGLTIAKYAKKEYPRFDVVVVDQRNMYSSCFCSNLWYSGVIGLEYLADHSFLDAAVENGYTYFNATCTGLDRTSKIVATSQGDIRYDFLVVAPGISYDYDKIGVTDVDTQFALHQHYPGGFIDPTEHVSIRRKINEFEGGLFVQTVPGGNYRCLPAPYERACMIASVIRRNKLKGKVLILDANPEITIKAPGFHAAFDELYKDIIEWRPSSAVTGIDVAKRTIKTEFDTVTFDDAAVYPNVRGSTLIERLGLMAPASRSNQKEANIDIRFYNLIGDMHVYVTGDSRPMPYSKSGNTSNSEGHYVAKVLAARAQGKEIAWTSPQTLCYSMVDADPTQAIWVDTFYGYDAAKDAITGFKDTKVDNTRSHENALTYLEWGRGMYRDMFRA